MISKENTDTRFGSSKGIELTNFLTKSYSFIKEYFSEIKNDTCGICLESLFNNQDNETELQNVVETKCNHIFHYQCLMRYFSIYYNNKIFLLNSIPFYCPNCRSVLGIANSRGDISCDFKLIVRQAIETKKKKFLLSNKEKNNISLITENINDLQSGNDNFKFKMKNGEITQGIIVPYNMDLSSKEIMNEKLENIISDNNNLIPIVDESDNNNLIPLVDESDNNNFRQLVHESDNISNLSNVSLPYGDSNASARLPPSRRRRQKKCCSIMGGTKKQTKKMKTRRKRRIKKQQTKKTMIGKTYKNR